MRLIDADAFAEFVHNYVLPKSPDGFVTKLSVLTALNHKSITPTIDKGNDVHANSWISVKDRLPENKKSVLVCLYDGRRKKVSNYPDGKRITIRIDRIVSDYGEPFWAKGNTPNVIAWMPLPEPPKEDEDVTRN